MACSHLLHKTASFKSQTYPQCNSVSFSGLRQDRLVLNMNVQRKAVVSSLWQTVNDVDHI